ncbi:MAG: KH domain-containing protein [Candidatus Altarchaeaceae archaeon]
MQYCKISEDRKGVLIGKDGKVKKEIEKMTKTKIYITDYVIIDGDPYGEILAEQIISAINLGFSAEKALLLLNDNFSYEFIPISGKRSTEIKGRIIGRNGTTRNIIEKISNTYICVGDEGVGIIGNEDDVEDVKECIMMLISGSTHGAAYRLLEKRMAEKRSF